LARRRSSEWQERRTRPVRLSFWLDFLGYKMPEWRFRWYRVHRDGSLPTITIEERQYSCRFLSQSLWSIFVEVN
jgi:hypothetical protein